MRTRLRINGTERFLDHEAGTSLLPALRDSGVVGPKRGCEAGDCGCCTVWLDGAAIQSCILPAWRARDRRVTTIEGLAQTMEDERTTAAQHGAYDGRQATSPPPLHPVQEAFLAEEGFQCGYCTAGMIMTLASPGARENRDIAWRTKGNICRCTGWKSIQRSADAITAHQKTAAAAAADAIETERSKPHSTADLVGTPSAAESADAIGIGKDESLSTTDRPGASRATPGSVGASVPNHHGRDVVTGVPSFTGDFLPTMPAELAYIAAVRSPHAHARITAVRAERALAHPGVIDVFWHEHVPRIPYTTACHPAEPRDAFDTYLLDDTMRFVGQRAAIVVAQSTAIARRAARLVEVDYEVLPAVFDPLEALKEGAPVIHPEDDSFRIADRTRNLIGRIDYRAGSPERAFAGADEVVELTVRTPRQQHTHMEPHAATAWSGADGTLVVRSSTQVPYLARRTVARVLDRPEESIRLFKPLVGGGFGNKQEVLCEDIVAFAAVRLARPVHWEFNRHEEFTATNTRHPMHITVRGGAARDGRLTALSLDFVTNGGAYGNHSYDVLECAAFEALSLYACPNKLTRGRAVYTNTVPAGAFRGYGAAQTAYAVECLMDELARRLALDPAEFRRRNAVAAAAPLHLEAEEDRDHKVGSYALDRCIDHVAHRLAELDIDRSGDEEVAHGWRYGSGLAISTIGSGLANIHVSGATMTYTADRVLLYTATADIGTASDTTLAQIAADALGLPYDRIDIVSGDTHNAPEDSGAYASATAYIAGKAVYLASTRLRSRILEVAAQLLGVPYDELTLSPNGSVTGVDSHAPLLTPGELVEGAHTINEELSVTVDRFAHDRVSMSFAAVGARVRVEEATGRVEMLDIVQAIDCGTLLNPRVCKGQAEGATVQSIGYALSEHLIIDDHGRVANPAFRDYRVPSIADIGRLETVFFEEADDAGPFGAKALGELTTTATPAAIANAVRDALGVRIAHLPITAEECWRAMHDTVPHRHTREYETRKDAIP